MKLSKRAGPYQRRFGWSDLVSFYSFYTLTHTLNDIWGVKQRRAVWKRRGFAILFVLIFVGPTLFLASFAGSMIAHLRTSLPAPIISMGAGLV